MATVYIGFGSNIQPEQNITAAVNTLRKQVRIIDVSTVYLTDPVGRHNSPQFYNGILQIETDTKPREFKYGILRNTEISLGRIRSDDKYEPRTIDLDIIVYNNLVLHEPDLIIPDPDIYERVFIAVPLLELNPGMILPDTGRKLADVASSFDTRTMTPLIEFTAALRKEITNEY